MKVKYQKDRLGVAICWYVSNRFHKGLWFRWSRKLSKWWTHSLNQVVSIWFNPQDNLSLNYNSYFEKLNFTWIIYLRTHWGGDQIIPPEIKGILIYFISAQITTGVVSGCLSFTSNNQFQSSKLYQFQLFKNLKKLITKIWEMRTECMMVYDDCTQTLILNFITDADKNGSNISSIS